MHLRIILAAVVFSFLTTGFASAKTAAPGDLRAFYGQVTAVNRAAKTITLKLGMSFVFRVTDETKISGPGGLLGFDAIKRGEGAEVVMRPGAVYQPPRQEFSRGLDFGRMRSGTFLLSVPPDGTVAAVKMLKTLGYEELDWRAVSWLKKMALPPEQRHRSADAYDLCPDALVMSSLNEMP